METGLIEGACRDIIHAFDQIIPTVYDPEDREKGGVESVSRQGIARFFPFIGISIGVTDTAVRSFSHFGELTGAASEMKQLRQEDQGELLQHRQARRAIRLRAPAGCPGVSALEKSVSRCDFLRRISSASQYVSIERQHFMKRADFRAAYLATNEQGLFPERIERAFSLLKECTVCPRECGIDRTRGEKGFCRAGDFPEISSYGPHFGEEKPLVGRNGSGTIFMTYCNLGCIFCQNYPISRLGEGYQDFFREVQRDHGGARAPRLP